MLAGLAGVSVETIKKLEQNERTSARIATLDLIARALQTSTSTLLSGGCTADGATARPPRDEEDATYRRTVLSIPLVAAQAATTSRQMAQADLDPLTFAEIEDDIDRITVSYSAMPHSDMLPLVQRRWKQVDQALAGRTSLASRTRLSKAAGQLSYFLSRLFFNCGDLNASRQLSVLAEQYARQTDDSVILASVAGMRSSIAYYRGRYDVAISVFDEYPSDPPYLAARNAAYRARAYARIGNSGAAGIELERMWHARANTPPEPGDLPLSEAALCMFAGWTLAFDGEGRRAEEFARQSIAGHDDMGSSASREEWAHALLMLAHSLLHRDNPAVDEAVAAATQAIGMINQHPTHTVIRRAEECAQDLRGHRTLPAVKNLYLRLNATPRPTLTEGHK